MLFQAEVFGVHFFLAHHPRHNGFLLEVFCEIHDFPFGCESEVERAGGFENAVELEQAVGHHSEIGHHVVLAEETAERLHHLGDGGVGRVHQFVELALGLLAPMPRVFKRDDLRLALVPLGRFEEEIVVALGIKRRVEIDEVNGFGRDVVTQDVQVVAIVKGVHGLVMYQGDGHGVEQFPGQAKCVQVWEFRVNGFLQPDVDAGAPNEVSLRRTVDSVSESGARRKPEKQIKLNQFSIHDKLPRNENKRDSRLRFSNNGRRIVSLCAVA